MKEEELLQVLKDAIMNYDKILLFLYNVRILEMIDNYCPQIVKKKTIILSEENMYYYSDFMDCIQLDNESAMALCHLYHTYEFSNKFTMLSTNNNFGTILNYVKTGLLSPKEAASVLFE